MSIALPKDASEIPSSKVRLTLSARKLKDADVFSKSDPMCVVYLSSGTLRDGAFRECGRTEMIKNTLNPEWTRTITIDYFFEETQKLRFDIYDIDSDSSRLSDHDFLGSVQSTLAEIVGASSSRKTFPVRSRDERGHFGDLTVIAEETENESKEIVAFTCRATDLRKKFLRSCNPFLQIYRVNDDGNVQLVHRTEKLKSTVNPQWPSFEVTLNRLCSNDLNRALRFECYSYKGNGSHGLIGKCETTVDRLVRKEDIDLPLVSEKRKARSGKGYIDSGRLVFVTVSKVHNPSFLDFIAGGTQLDFSVAIDLTASNGRVSEPSSLHYMGDPTRPNEYHVAIRAVVDICQHYNASKMFHAMGFGAKLPPSNTVNHCFPLNIGSSSYSVSGVQGILEAYQRCIQGCILFGPTYFAPIIAEAAKKASSYPRNGSRYQILLIITDGCINDFDKTTEAIIAASYLPLSIIIVGVGGANFEAMVGLDSDDRLLTHQGRTAQRDIVQFVPLREFLDKKNASMNAGGSEVASARLAKEVLAEVPDQLTSYMKANHIQPRPASDPFPAPLPPPTHIAGWPNPTGPPSTSEVGSPLPQWSPSHGFAPSDRARPPPLGFIQPTQSVHVGTAPYAPADSQVPAYPNGSQRARPTGISQVSYPGPTPQTPPYPASVSQTGYPVSVPQTPYPASIPQFPHPASPSQVAGPSYPVQHSSYPAHSGYSSGYPGSRAHTNSRPPTAPTYWHS